MLRRHGIKMPSRKWHRQVLGWGLVAGGMVGFLPIVGFWMLPLGLVVLSVDNPAIRRLRRRAVVRWGRRRRQHRPRGQDSRRARG